MEQDGADVQSKTRRRIKWRDEMNVVLLSCEKTAQLLVKSNEPPPAENGRRKAYMLVMKELWDEMGHEHLNLSLKPKLARSGCSPGKIITQCCK